MGKPVWCPSVARRSQVTLEDDIDGGSAAETVSFGLDGRGYEIDLSKKNAGKLRKLFAPYVSAARSTGRASRPAARLSDAADPGVSAADVRAWASEAGFQVSARGRIPADVLAAYRAQHGSAAPPSD